MYYFAPVPAPEHILYLSYDGMTDPLGQSQVIPYLQGLSKEGYIIHLISFEKAAAFKKDGPAIRLLLGTSGIYWTPLSYTKFPPVISTMYDLERMIRSGRQLIRRHGIRLIHCRSYIAGLAGLKLKKQTGARFLFDMRGFWADERVDGKLWDLSNPVFKKVFEYFKSREKQMLAEADGVISLTHAAKKVISDWGYRSSGKLPVEVIPCCADLEHFDRSRVSESNRQQLYKELELLQKQPVISYLGAVGTWYLLDEMMRFFAGVLRKYPAAVFLFITREPRTHLMAAAQKAGIPEASIRIRPGARKEIPALLSLSDVSVFFITPAFSKTASSPTKQGEIMGMGIPVICNAGIGDTDTIVEKYRSGLVINLQDPEAITRAVNAIEDLRKLDAEQIRKGACDYFSLEHGVQQYAAYYRQILNL